MTRIVAASACLLPCLSCAPESRVGVWNRQTQDMNTVRVVLGDTLDDASATPVALDKVPAGKLSGRVSKRGAGAWAIEWYDSGGVIRRASGQMTRGSENAIIVRAGGVVSSTNLEADDTASPLSP